MSPPVARVDKVRETYAGVTVEDPYRWMEEESEEFDSWLRGQGEYARRVLDALPHRAALLARIRGPHGDGVSREKFALAGDRVFCLRTGADDMVPALVELTAGGRVLFDPNVLGGSVHSSIDWYVPSPDGGLVACAVSTGGSEKATIRVVDVDSGMVLADAIRYVRMAYLSWLDDGRSFLYHRYEERPGATPATRRSDTRSLLHRLGDDPARDTVLLARGLNPRIPLAPLDRPFLYRVPGGDRVLAIVSHAALRGDRIGEDMGSCTFYVAPLDGLSDPASCPWARVAGPADDVTAFALGPDALYLVSHRDAPRSRVLAVPLADPGAVRLLVPESERVVHSIRVVGDRLLIRDLAGGHGRLRQVPLAGGPPRDIPVPLDGAIQQWTRETGDSVLFTLESWTVAPRVYRYEAGTVSDTGWGAQTPDGFGDVEAYQIQAPARDGTPIPVSVIHRRGLALDGDNPTILNGYGSYGIPMGPQFRPGMLAWLERGGVWAVAHIRGGGEYGHDWHEAGRHLRKENTITDFIDCAEHLIALGYTKPARLAGSGGSAGGIPTGGALVRRPDLFAAMVMHVPLTNALRMEFSENGPVNIPELGTVTTGEGARGLLIVDSYARVRDGVRYPAVLVTCGRNDSRVAAWLPGKMAARLQAATASGRPVLLRVEDDAGHGFGSTVDQVSAELADELAFLLDRLG